VQQPLRGAGAVINQRPHTKRLLHALQDNVAK